MARKRSAATADATDLAAKRPAADAGHEPVAQEEPASSTVAVGPQTGYTRLGRRFFDVPSERLAVDLLGKYVTRATAEGEPPLRGRIVETEAYPGGADAASHSGGGRRTERNEAMFMQPGTVYVYSIYGMHHCVNISSRGAGAAVLLRAVEPLADCAPAMGRRRRAGKRGAKADVPARLLCAGPGRLAQAFGVDRALDRADACAPDAPLYVCAAAGEPVLSPADIVNTARIGIGKCPEEAVDAKLRWHIAGNECVSRK